MKTIEKKKNSCVILKNLNNSTEYSISVVMVGGWIESHFHLA